MPENHQSEQGKNNNIFHDDEIELIDILRILWKRKYIILAGTAAIVVMILAISLSMPKMYRSKIVMKPGLSHVDKKGKWISLDSPSNMQFLIESELIYKLEKQLGEMKESGLTPILNYKTLVDDSRNTLTVFYDSQDSSEGLEKLRYLTDALKEFYKKRLQPFLRKYEREIALAEKEIALNLNEKEFINSNLKDIHSSLWKFKHQNDVGTDSDYPKDQLGKFLEQYTAIIDRVARLQKGQTKIDLNISNLNDKIAQLENEKKMLAPIRVIQPPTQVSAPNRSKIRLSLVSAPVIGFFVMVFLVLFIEYVRKVIAKIKQEKIFE
jgi:LPS O-antigen subunit length determinant protein (WzzB/FepE family)